MIEETEEIVCIICERPIKGYVSPHHLIPRSIDPNSSKTIPTHNSCHNELHHSYSNSMLSEKYNTEEKLRGIKRILMPLCIRTHVFNMPSNRNGRYYGVDWFPKGSKYRKRKVKFI